MNDPSATAMKVALLEAREGSIGNSDALVVRLAADGFEVEKFEASKHFYQRMLTEIFFAVVLDAEMLDENDIEVFRYLHSRSDIVVMAASRSSSANVRSSLRANACFDKPLDVERVAVDLRNSERLARSRVSAAAGCASWRLDPSGWKLYVPGGKGVALNFHEYLVMEKLLAFPGKVIAKEELIEAIGGDAYHFDPHRLEMLVHRLRNKVKATTGRPMPLHGVRGKGYAMAGAADEPASLHGAPRRLS